MAIQQTFPDTTRLTAAAQQLRTRSAAGGHPRLRRFLIDAALTAAFNTLIALAITYLTQLGPGFGANLVFSMCIGMLAFALIDGGRLLLWGEGKPSWRIFPLVAIAIPLAYYGGHTLAAWLLGTAAHHDQAFDIRYAAGSLVLTMLACLFGTWFFWSRGKLQYLETQAALEKARAAAIEKQALQAQLQMLQAQIEPHMLFNTLANLQGLIDADPPRAQHMLDQLIQYLRATLQASRNGHTTLQQEFALLHAYLELMAIRMGPRLSYALDLPPALRAMPLPPMLLQPLVENAIRHGLEPKIEGGRIEVAAHSEGGMLHLSVSDTGLGLALEVPGTPAAPAARVATSGTGLGLANLRARLQALYGERAHLHLQANQPAGAIVRLTLPLNP